MQNHNCVIIPEFGGFITSEKACFYDSKKEMFFPASIKILFNKNLVFNDGLLASRIAERQSISFEKATNQLVQYKDDFYVKLNENGRYEIEKVGVLFFDKEKNIQFQQADKSSFGLSPKSVSKIKITPVVVKEKVTPILVERKIESEKIDRKPTVERTKPLQKQTSRKRRNIGAILIPFIVAPMLLATVFFGNQAGVIGNSPIHLASLNPFQSTTTEFYTPRNGNSFLAETKPLAVENKMVIPETIKEVIPAKVETTFNKIETSTITPISLKYHVIAGCFGVKENADNFVTTWNNRGNSSSIIDKKGKLYRVAIQSFATRKEAKNFKKEMKEEYKISSWVLKK